MVEVIWEKGKPHCPCGSHQLETKLIASKYALIITELYCSVCHEEVTITPELKDYIEAKGWKVRA